MTFAFFVFVVLFLILLGSLVYVTLMWVKEVNENDGKPPPAPRKATVEDLTEMSIYKDKTVSHKNRQDRGTFSSLDEAREFVARHAASLKPVAIERMADGTFHVIEVGVAMNEDIKYVLADSPDGHSVFLYPDVPVGSNEIYEFHSNRMWPGFGGQIIDSMSRTTLDNAMTACRKNTECNHVVLAKDYGYYAPNSYLLVKGAPNVASKGMLFDPEFDTFAR